MDNGCKYSEDHLVEVELCNNYDEINIHFSDKGIGIPEEELRLVFQPFYRAKNAIGFKGHGIGLSLVEKIIALHGGEIAILSGLSKGTRITVRLPLVKIIQQVENHIIPHL
jgi:signal transduction histidine kinase